MVHDRRLGKRIFNFGVSGRVKDGNLIMYDRETGSLWLQKSGAALEGKLAGKKLKELPKANYEAGIRWDEWRVRHPGSKVLHCEHCLSRPGAASK